VKDVDPTKSLSERSVSVGRSPRTVCPEKENDAGGLVGIESEYAQPTAF
jgi:hypothetical protein